MVLVCQCPAEEEGVHNCNDWPTNCWRAIKVSANADCVGGAQHPMWNTPRHDAYGNFSFVFQSFKPDSQHVTLPEVNCLKTEMIDIVPNIDKVRVPHGPKRVDWADVIIFSKSGRYNLIFAVLKDNYSSPQAFRVHMEWTDSPFSPNKRPLSVQLDVRSSKHSSIIKRNTRLGYFMWCYASKLTGNKKVSLVSWKQNGVYWRTIFTWQVSGYGIKLP